MNKILYYIVFSVWYAMSLLPLRVLYVLSDLLFWLLYKVVGYRKRVVRTNLSESFPEKSEEELRGIERGFYRFFCDYIVETMKMMTISREELMRRMTYKGMKQIDEVVESGQSVALSGPLLQLGMGNFNSSLVHAKSKMRTNLSSIGEQGLRQALPAQP